MKRSLEMFISFHRSCTPRGPSTILSTILLGGDAGGLGLVLDLLAVLVGAGEEHDIIALQSLVAGHGVGGHGAVGVADVQLVRRVVDGRGDIKCFLLLIFQRNPSCIGMPQSGGVAYRLLYYSIVFPQTQGGFCRGRWPLRPPICEEGWRPPLRSTLMRALRPAPREFMRSW